MNEIKLINNIKTCLKINKNTPRVALTLNLSIPNEEKYAGEYLLMTRLLMQGTKKYSSKELANILEENAIDMFTEMKFDYFRFRFIALNEDFELALSILSDIIHNSTFEEFEKERTKLKGEILAEMDSAKVKLSDLFTKTIYKNHFYGHSYSKILEDIDKVTLDDIKSVYNNILETSNKVLVVVGDFDKDKTIDLLNVHLGNLPQSKDFYSKIPSLEKINQEYVETIQNDAQQAQILQGWRVPTVGSNDYEKIMLLNIILGASGLSSRLFLELREKKGLAYTVRTSYENHMRGSSFSIYIGTEPSNIQTSIEGFKVEIEKIKHELISDEELKNAKNNIIGKQQFITETNSQQANLMSYYATYGLDFNYQEKVIENIKKITSQELLDCANKFFNDDYILAIVKP